MFMRIGGKKLVLSLGLLCLLISLCSSQLPNMINNNMKAESTEIDDGPLGEKIVDIAGAYYTVGTGYALTENGEVYAWGYNQNGELGNGEISKQSQRKPTKILNSEDATDGNYYLSDIIKIWGGGANGSTEYTSGGFAFALKSNGELYAWGDNRHGNLGLPNKTSITKPEKVPIDFQVKKIFCGTSSTIILSTEGEVYVAGISKKSSFLGLGENVEQIDTFTKLTQDNEGYPLPKMIDVTIKPDGVGMISETKNLYLAGSFTLLGQGTATNAYYPMRIKRQDGSFFNNVENFAFSGSSGAIMVTTTDGTVYNSINVDASGLDVYFYVPIHSLSNFKDDNNVFHHVKVTENAGQTTMFLSEDNSIYMINNVWVVDGINNSSQKYEILPFKGTGDVLADYKNAKKVVGHNGFWSSIILSKNGGVYCDGIKLSFGDINVSARKSESNAIYNSKEKYNGDVTLHINTDTTNLDKLLYDETDLITGETKTAQPTDGTLPVSAIEGERVYKKYNFYIDTMKQQTTYSFIVDLYKNELSITDIQSGVKYPVDKTISFDYNGFEDNTIQAFLQPQDQEETAYLTDTKIENAGNYKLRFIDLYGNTNTYTFAITDDPIAEAVIFTPTDPDGLIYGNDCTKTGNTIGTLSLKYPTGKPTYEIDTITLGDSATSQFEIVNKTELKVIGNNLNAGTYTIPVTGTDTNGMDFSGSFTITIAQANQTMDWTDALKAYQSSGINKDTKLTLQVKDVLDDAEVTYGLKDSNTCVSVVPTTGVVTITCVPDSKEISLTATAKATTNYDTKTIELTLPFTKEYIPLTVATTSENKAYTSGTWAKHDVTFTITGGLSQDDLEGYEYAVTDGSNPNNDTNWTAMSTNTLALTSSIKDKTYWFRVVPHDPSGTYSKGIKVNLDVDQPSIPTLSVEEINQTEVAKLINMLSFGNWMNKQAKVTMTSSDTTSGVDHYEYIEKVNGTESQPKKGNGTITYGDKTELTLKARACDKAGNCSAYTNAEEVKIDLKAPTITGVKDQGEYKQYYLPRFVTVTDPVSGLKQATYKKDNTPAGTFTDNVETPIRGQGTYEIYAIDEAGNEVTLTFKIVKLPDIKTEIDGSDESRDIIDQIIKEYEEVKEKIDQNEKDNYEQWIKEAEEKWDSLRTKVVEDDKTTSKVEGQGDTTFDPKTELIVEEIPKDKVPVLPKNAIKTFDVYLKKGNDVVSPDGTVKVYLPYKESEAPIVYEINADGSYKEITVSHEGEYVTFVTNTLKKYAISNTAQEDTKKDVCVVGPDGKPDTTDDVCGEGNGSGVPPVKEEDGTVTVPDGGKVIFPDKEVPAPDGATINPDGSVDFPDGSHYDPDGNKTKDPDQKPDPNPDDGKNENICVAGPDGKLGTDDDVCGEGNGKEEPEKENNGSVTVPDGGKVVFPDKEVPAPDGATINPDGSVDFPDGTHFDPDGNKTKDPDQKPDPKPNPDDGKKPDDGSDNNDKVCVAGPDGKLGTSDDVCGNGNDTKDPEKNPDGSITVPDGGSVIFPDGSEVELPDGGTIKPDGSVELPDGTEYDPNGNKKDPNKDKEQCKLEGIKINIDTDKDNLPDINLDTDGDCKADLNIDIDNDNIPDLNIDNNGDGKADINIDTDGDGIADLNIMFNIKKWIPNLNGKINGFSYDTMSGLEPDLNVDDNGDGQPDRNIDTNGDNIPDVNVDDDWFSKHGMKEPNDNSTVQGNYSKGNSATSGVNTGDSTKWIIWWIILLITLSSMTYALIKRRKKRNNKYY